MDQDIRRIESQPKPGTDKGKTEVKEKKEEEKKPGFFKKIWGSVFDKKIKDLDILKAKYKQDLANIISDPYKKLKDNFKKIYQCNNAFNSEEFQCVT